MRSVLNMHEKLFIKTRSLINLILRRKQNRKEHERLNEHFSLAYLIASLIIALSFKRALGK